MQIERISIDRVNPAAYNPRRDLQPGDSEYLKLQRSIEQFGIVEPLVWNRRTGNLVGGHQRLKILKARGDSEVYVSVIDLSLEREKLLNVALNKIAGDWDQRKLAELLDELVQLPAFDVELTGFDVPDVNALIAEALPHPEDGSEDNFDVEAELAANRPLVTQPGDLIELRTLNSDPRFRGHRLLCGDCTDPALVQRLMQGERAILFCTDPPYLVGYDGTNYPGKSKRIEKLKNKDWATTYGITWDDADAKIRGRRHQQHRPTLIVVDDIENETEVRSDEQRQHKEDWFNKAVLKAGTGATNVIVVGTILHYEGRAGKGRRLGRGGRGTVWMEA